MKKVCGNEGEDLVYQELELLNNFFCEGLAIIQWKLISCINVAVYLRSPIPNNSTVVSV